MLSARLFSQDCFELNIFQGSTAEIMPKIMCLGPDVYTMEYMHYASW